VIEGKLGAGGMGQVYKARQPSLDRMIALKVLPRSVASNRESVERFYREAKSAAGLVHPNIVQIYTVGEEKGVPYFAMEYVVGEDLERRTRRGEVLKVDEVVGVVASVAMALACAEESGIVHRDVKPGNIMIDSHGVVKVTDFGLAKAVKLIDSDITQAGFIVGTPTYMSPEQAEGGAVDHRSDIYSLGVVFYELLCGKPPFVSEDPATLIYQHVHKPAEPPRGLREGIPEDVEKACLKCLAKKPAERYQNAAELLADLVKIQESMGSSSSDEGGIVFDHRMASKLISSQATKRPTGVGVTASGTPPSTEQTLVMRGRPMARHWPALAAGGAAVGVLVLVAVLAFVFTTKPGPGGDPSAAPSAGGAGDAGGGVASPTDGGGGRATPTRGPVLPFSLLEGALPEGTVIEISEGGSAPYRIREFVDQGFAPGRVTVRVSRPYYKEIVREFDVKPTGPVPEFAAALFLLEPDEELVKLIEGARAAIEKEDFAGASQTVNRVRAADPAATALPEIESLLADRRAAWSQRWTEVFEKARKLIDEGGADAAGELLSGVPPLHQHYEAAQTLQRNIAEAKKNLREGRGFIEERLCKGEFGEARSRYEWLVNDVRTPRETLADLVKRLEEAEALEKAAREADRAGKPELARAKYLKLAEIATESANLRARCAELDEVITRGGAARKLIAVIEEEITRNAFARAREKLDELRGIDPANAQIADIDSRITKLAAEHEIASFLEKMDGALLGTSAGGDGARLADLVDPGNAELSASVRAAMDTLAECAMKFSATRFRLKVLKLRAEGAEADVKWEYALDVPVAGRKMAGVEEVRLSLSRRPQGWRLASVTAGPSEGARLLGGGGEEGRIQGLVIRVEGGLVTINRGASHGVKTKMIFTLHREARVVKMPLVGKVVVVEEEKVGEARVVEVRREECLASFLGDPGGANALEVGMLAVQSPLMSVAAAPPAIKTLRGSRASAAAGDTVDLELVVRNVDGVPAYYLWETDGGRVRPERTTVPRAVWTAPRRAGEYAVRVVAVSPLGSSRPCETKLTSEGAPATAAAGAKLGVVGEIAIGAPFTTAGDIAFDEANRAYVLDSRTTKLLIFSPALVLESASSPYRKGRPERVKSARGHVYVLDSTRSVKRYSAGKDPFASPAGTSYGAPGQGNGKLLKPVDFALSPTGEVAVLDAGTCTVQVFGPDGRFLASFGAKGRVAGELLQPKSIVADSRGAFYVLDVGRRQVLVFRKGGYSGEFPVGGADGTPADLAYDAVGDVLLVLDEKTSEVLAYTAGGVKLPAPAVRAGGTPAKGTPPLGSLRRPSVIACDGTSHLYVISGDRSGNIDRFELARGSEAPAKFAGRLSATAPVTFARVAASPAGDLYLLDQTTGLLWQLGPGGRVTGELGGPGDTASWSKAKDVATDSSGDFYVLDHSLCTVRRFSPDAVRPGVKPRTRFGRKAKATEKDGLVGPVAIAGTPAGAASQVSVPGAGPADFVAVLLGERAMGIHVFLQDGTAQPPFPGTNDGRRQGSNVAIGADGNIYVGSAGLLESFSLDGRMLARTPLPTGEPAGLAASADGRIYALDAGRGRKVVGVAPDTGKVVATFDVPRSIRSPTDIACDGFGTLYLLDGRARRIYELRPAAAAAE
jgi:tRNA A-37 threonylcarbamoyl transferase component Bud32/outer membrane protein assembly factor BamB